MRTIIVRAADTRGGMETNGADVEERHCTTRKEARARAQYLLTPEYARRAEMQQPFGFAQVLVNDDVEEEYGA